MEGDRPRDAFIIRCLRDSLGIDRLSAVDVAEWNLFFFCFYFWSVINNILVDDNHRKLADDTKKSDGAILHFSKLLTLS